MPQKAKPLAASTQCGGSHENISAWRQVGYKNTETKNASIVFNKECSLPNGRQKRKNIITPHSERAMKKLSLFHRPFLYGSIYIAFLRKAVTLPKEPTHHQIKNSAPSA